MNVSEYKRERDKLNEKKFNILYVDDEEASLRIFKQAFRRDYNVFTAQNGDEALKVMKSDQIQLIITDQQMPNMTGVQLLREVVQETPNVLRMIMTGFSDIGVLMNAVNEVGISKYLKKPWNRESLKEIIDEELNMHKNRASASGGMEQAGSDLSDSVNFVKNSLLKSEDEFQKVFPSAYLISRIPKSGSSDLHWVGVRAGKKIYCRVDIYSPDRSLTNVLTGIYSQISDAVTFASKDRVNGEDLFVDIVALLQSKSYLSYIKRRSDKSIGLIVMVYDDLGVNIRSNHSFGHILLNNQELIPLKGSVIKKSSEISRIMIYSSRLSQIQHRNSTFEEVVCSSCDLPIPEQKKFISNELDFYLSSNAQRNGLNIFLMEF